MKVGIITFHFTTNQGAVLQCYALKTWLEKHGHEVQVINYRPGYHTIRYQPHKNPFLIARGAWRKRNYLSMPKRVYAAGVSFFHTLQENKENFDAEKFRLFSSFAEEYLSETRVYPSLKSLQNDPPQLDVYISGSDQLWNPDLLDMVLDGAYFLDFGDKRTKKITYAVSAKEHYNNKEKRLIANYCEGLDAVSIREKNKDIDEVLKGREKVCIDPTLLLDKDSYVCIQSERLVSEPYLFVYGFENSTEINTAIHVIAEKYHLKIINGCPHRIKISDPHESVYDYDPKDFLSYIANAHFVISNSFHATAFSIIYEKDFVVVPHSTRGKRMTELLEKLGIKDRVWNNDSQDVSELIDYKSVKDRLLMLRKESEDYLLQQLKEN